MAIPDPVEAVRDLLAADAAVSALVGARVFAAELPDAEAVDMPRAAVVVAASGGPPDRGSADLVRQRIDVRSYGATPATATDVAQAVQDALKNAGRTAVTLATGQALLHAVTPESGASTLRDADGRWPLVLRIYEVFASEVSVT